MKKRILCLLLSCIFFLNGCAFWNGRINSVTTFYYLCANYPQDLCCVFATEERDISGHEGDLSYLLALYLMGPTSDEQLMPLPSGTRINAENNDGHIVLTLNTPHSYFSDISFSLACVCLTMTCLEITDAIDVTICWNDTEWVLSPDSLTLHDSTNETAPSEEPQ